MPPQNLSASGPPAPGRRLRRRLHDEALASRAPAHLPRRHRLIVAAGLAGLAGVVSQDARAVTALDAWLGNMRDPARGARPLASRAPMHEVADPSARFFEDVRAKGRAVKIDADDNVEALRSACGKDDGASRLGEIALVDGEPLIVVADPLSG